MKDRYQRITELGWERRILENTAVLVVGAGALGNEVLKNLALLGVGKIVIVDMDTIAGHNLSRTVLFRAEDVGRYKAEVAAERVGDLNPDVSVDYLIKPIQQAFGLARYYEFSVVFACLDNIQARIDVNRYCYQAGVCFIDAGLRLLDGDIKVFGGDYEVCLDCTISQQLRQEAWKRFSCLKLRSRNEEAATLPTAPTIASIMAGLQVQIAMKYLHHLAVPFNKRLSIFGHIDEFGASHLQFNPYCPTHHLYEPIQQNDWITVPIPYEDLSVGDLMTFVVDQLGHAEASLYLDYDLITAYYCPHHDFKQVIYQARGTVFVDEATCDLCKASGKPSVHAIMRESFINRIGLDAPDLLLKKWVGAIGLVKDVVLCGKYEDKTQWFRLK